MNAKKSNYLIFHPYQQKIQSVINLKVFDNEHKAFRNLERKQFVKYLGVLIDSYLSWNDHVAYVALKVSKTIGIITKKQILLIQKRALCLIYFSNNSEHAIPLFLRSNILLIDILYYKSAGVLFDA